MIKKFLDLTILALLLSFQAAADDHDLASPYHGQLILAEKNRRNNTVLFDQIMLELSKEYGQMSASDQCYYDYLQIYKFSLKGEYVETLEQLNELLARCPYEQHQLRALQLMAILEVISGDFEPSLTHLNESIALAEKYNDPYLNSMNQIVAAIAYRLMNQDDLSLKYADLLIEGAYSQDDVCMGRFNKYRVLLRQGQGATLNGELDEAIEHCQSLNNHIAASFLQLDRIRYRFPSNTSARPKQIQSGLNALKGLAEEVESTNFKNLQVYYQSMLAHMHWLAGQMEEAKSHALASLDDNQSIGYSEQLLIALNVLIELSLDKEEIQPAYHYLLQKSHIERSMYEDKMKSQVAYFRVKHNNLAKDFQIEQLDQKNKLLVLENLLAKETSKKQNLLILLVLLLLLTLTLWAFRIKRRHDYFKDVAEIDHLTQVFTRKAFEDRVKLMIADCESKQQSLNLAIMDLDHFKQVNDDYGHLVGDWVLKHAVEVCEQVMDEDVLMARLGGEEFCLVCPDIDPERMEKLMEKMRFAIEYMDCSESESDVSVTASFGVSNTSLSGYRLSMLLTHADLALFEAKNGGRNQVVIYTPVA